MCAPVPVLLLGEQVHTMRCVFLGEEGEELAGGWQ